MIDRSALGIAAAIKARKISPVEVARHFLEEVDRLNPDINAFVWRRDADLLEEAKAAEDAVMRGDDLAPFHGVPIPLKDLAEAVGHTVTHGSRAARSKVGRMDTAAVGLLRKAGFLFMGRTNSPEFGTLPVTENVLHGATRNPYDLTRTPGGSSGGAAAAVAAGMAPIAHASDGGGSIRIPASCCGLVGLKPSRGRIAKGPLVSEVMHGFTTDGCVSRGVADTAAVLDALSTFDPATWMTLPTPSTSYLSLLSQKAPRLRIGFTIHGPYSGVSVDQSSIDAVTRTATILSELGHDVRPVQIDWPHVDKPLARDFIAVWCTGSAYQQVQDWSEVEPLNQALKEMCQRQSSFDYTQAVLRLQIFARKILASWGENFDLLLSPTLAIEPPPIGWLYASGLKDAEDLLWRCTEMVPFTGWCNVTGQPAISLPTYTAPSGLPVGVQIVAPPAREDLLLMIGAELEEVCGWG
ncbi:MAG: 6-aminohexanoate-cyclic-dimer hydrolase [Pseudomonadota bacterium]|jgi:amidase